MPMDDDTDYGTNEDKSPSYDYCMHCFQEGRFVVETESLEDFVDQMLVAMKSDENAPEMKKEEAVMMLKELGRWKKG